MISDEQPRRFTVDHDSLPRLFPTHRHSPEFWEHLGRTIATFGFLEEVLGKAIFAYTATRQYPENELQAAYEAWIPRLELALKASGSNLVEMYGKEVRNHPENTTEDIAGLVEAVKRALEIRNVLCHGSWRSPDENGASVPHYVNNRDEIFTTKIDVTYLSQVREHVAELVCVIIGSVTHMGWQFPGGAGPGKPICT